MNETEKLILLMILVFFFVLMLNGCGSEGNANPFSTTNAGEYCDVRGGVQLIEGGYIYCNDGSYIEESALDE